MTTREHIEQNVLPYFNIKEYWDKGFKGQGVTIASVESTDSGHGSMVADTLLTYAPECKVISFNDEHPDYSATGDDGTNVRFPEFVDWCIENKVDIVTSSLDWSCDKEEEKEAIRKLYDNGIIFCNCAGNSGSHITRENTKKTWGFDEEILTISGIGLSVSNKVTWSGFNYGEAVDLCTLGSNCPAFTRDGNVSYAWSGTSSATPMCAGMLAVYKSYNKELNSKNVFELIVNKMTSYCIYKDYAHAIFKLPPIKEEIVMEQPKEETKPDWKIEFEEVWERATKLKVVDGTRPSDPITRNELVVILDRLGLLK